MVAAYRTRLSRRMSPTFTARAVGSILGSNVRKATNIDSEVEGVDSLSRSFNKTPPKLVATPDDPDEADERPDTELPGRALGRRLSS